MRFVAGSLQSAPTAFPFNGIYLLQTDKHFTSMSSSTLTLHNLAHNLTDLNWSPTHNLHDFETIELQLNSMSKWISCPKNQQLKNSTRERDQPPRIQGGGMLTRIVVYRRTHFDRRLETRWKKSTVCMYYCYIFYLFAITVQCGNIDSHVYQKISHQLTIIIKERQATHIYRVITLIV